MIFNYQFKTTENFSVLCNFSADSNLNSFGFAETIVEPNQKQYPWYHQRFHRVPTIDQCYTDDPICVYEADTQFKRDKLVDNEILTVLRHRYEDCTIYEAPDDQDKCMYIWDVYKKNETNWFSKCKWLSWSIVSSESCITFSIWNYFSDGDLGFYSDAKGAFMKQKHRMVWERRHGKIGSGRNEQPESEEH